MEGSKPDRCEHDVAPVPPLTRGGLSRPVEVEREISRALDLSRRDLIRWLRMSDDSAPKVETIVHVLRKAAREDDRDVMETATAALIEACRPRLSTMLRGFDNDTRTEMLGDALAEIVEGLITEDDRFDFAEVRFWRFLKQRALTAAAREITRLERSHLRSDDTEAWGEAANAPMGAEELSILREAMQSLPADLRQIFLLRHQFGWNIGPDDPSADDPHDPSLAGLLGISGRAVRKRLAKAETLLARYRNDRND